MDLGDETIGQRIARIRKLRELKQAELAETIGITYHLICDYENGDCRIHDAMLARIAGVLA
jgi:transcriptional regulator with XRE-family HTH domain